MVKKSFNVLLIQKDYIGYSEQRIQKFDFEIHMLTSGHVLIVRCSDYTSTELSVGRGGRNKQVIIPLFLFSNELTALPRKENHGSQPRVISLVLENRNPSVRKKQGKICSYLTLRPQYSFYSLIMNCWPQIKTLSFASVDANQITNWV